MEKLDPEIARLFTAKETRRRKLASLPYPDKVRIVVQLQQMAAPLLRARGRKVCIWPVDDPSAPFRDPISDGDT